jgi:hypothetical protein
MPSHSLAEVTRPGAPGKRFLATTRHQGGEPAKKLGPAAF